ncbi:MAG: hypothetical protein ABR552_04345 [Actinomycetota bacterium]|nr:hypothetical protein [Actinomycetota bacterium]
MSSKRLLVIPIIVSMIAVVTGTGVWQASAAAVPGVDNHGTIKISSVDDPPDPSNDPHPGCPFRVDFFGFKAGTYDITITGWPPTGGGVLKTDVITIPTTTHGNTFQVSRTYDLSAALADITPANQGYHVRLDAKRRGTPGNGSKTKVFWLTCPAGATPTPSVTPTVSVSPTGTVTTPTPSVTPTVSASGGPAVLGTTTTRSPRSTQVLGLRVTRGLANTGSPTQTVAAFGALFVLLGLCLSRSGRKRRLEV